MAKIQTSYLCQECGYRTVRWLGRCPDCGQWNTFAQEQKKAVKHSPSAAVKTPQILGAQEEEILHPWPTGLGEFDRTLGGGVIPGSVVLLGGDPGVGKTTLLLQVAHSLAGNKKVLFVSGEESYSQLNLRARRLNLGANKIYLSNEVSWAALEAQIAALAPQLLVVDSIQTMHCEDLPSAPGTLLQVRESALRLLRLAKENNMATILIGHITKDGAIAGPKSLEHMVDTVIYFEGERSHQYRILRTVKNRFGAAEEIGVFSIGGDGLKEVENPSSFLVAERPLGISGSAILAAVEGSRALLVEVQSLATFATSAYPRRLATGVDYNRALLILAILEKRMGLVMSTLDVYIKVAGGIRLTEPAADLGVAAAVASSVRNLPLPPKVVLAGEVGLGGELRPISLVERRLMEAGRMGFEQIIIPWGNRQEVGGRSPIEVKLCKHIEEVGDLLWD